MKRVFWLMMFLASPSWAATYYVRSTAAAGHTCTQAQTDNDSNARNTINLGLACLSSGDTLIIHAGTYAERINTFTGSNLPAGGSWATATTVKSAGDGAVILTGTDPIADGG